MYRKQTEPCRDPVEFALFVAFFPQLIAGPILRADELLPQLRAGRTPRRREIVRGAEPFALGLVKKVVFADNIGALIDPVMRRPELYTGASVGVASLLFAAQIYCDFSGYSTMARGLGHLFGFTLPRNFDSPWMQGTPMGYRRGWHITIARWFGDYVYKPLGGTRVALPRAVFNIMLLWLLVLHAVAFRWYVEDLLNRLGPVRRALVFGGVAWLLLVAAPAAQPFIYYQFGPGRAPGPGGCAGRRPAVRCGRGRRRRFRGRPGR